MAKCQVSTRRKGQAAVQLKRKGAPKGKACPIFSQKLCPTDFLFQYTIILSFHIVQHCFLLGWWIQLSWLDHFILKEQKVATQIKLLVVFFGQFLKLLEHQIILKNLLFLKLLVFSFLSSLVNQNQSSSVILA